MAGDNEEQGGNQRPPGWQPLGPLEQPQQLPGPQLPQEQQQLHTIANAMSEEQKKRLYFHHQG
ncbi:MAG: hypothetical protein GY696_00025 [Gammaproteobacteria bacterium]|nr:hypothetical protein [Gammaproteobacteria bacterium]